MKNIETGSANIGVMNSVNGEFYSGSSQLEFISKCSIPVTHCCSFNSKHMYHIFFSKKHNGIHDFTDAFINFVCMFVYIYMYVTVFFTHMSYNM